MARGSIAKQQVANKLAEVLGNDWIGEYDKKYYVWANDGGERVQIAISMTCPKTPIEVAAVAEPAGDWDFTDEGTKTATLVVSNAAPAEITQEEVDNLAALMERLGL